MLADLGLGHHNIDACVNNCFLYYKDNKDEVECPHCYEPRYEAFTSSKQKKPIPRKVLRYFPLGPRSRRHLSEDHEWWWDADAFDGIEEHNLKPLRRSGNIARCVKMGENKISGLKTHDCHVLLQRLLPVVIRPYLQSDVVDTLVAWSKFFQRICAKELKKSNARSLQEDIVNIMCKLERIFPPTFFDIMIHLMIHFPEQVLLTGPATGGFQEEDHKNKRFPEGSITAAYNQVECITYCSAYLNDEDTVGESSGASSSWQFNLSVVFNDVEPYGRLSNSERLSNDEIKEAHWCVLQHCEEAEQYFKSHLDRQYGNEVIHKRDFPDYFLIWMMHIQQQFPASYDPELHLLAGGP
ncbi:PREDICTED: uncharacterized protein LOC101296908 [Fragaria vesca subsp. vesca]